MRKKQIVWGVVLGVLGVVVLAAAVVLHTVTSLLNNADYMDEDNELGSPRPEQEEVVDFVPEDLSSLEVRGNNDYVTNYLLIGCDARGSSRGRADTIVLLSVNDATKTIRLVSLMRDLWVTVPALGYPTKINAAYSHGGFEALLDTVEANLCLDIDQAVRVDFTAFQNAIDVLGGIDVYVDERAARCIPKEDPGNPDSFAVADDWVTQIREPIGTTAGVYHLQGFQALSFCRLRKIYPDSDYSRTENQRRVIASLLVTAAENPSKIYGVLSAILREVTLYRLPRSELLGILLNAGQYLSYEIDTDYRLNYQGSRTPSGASILLLPDQEQQVMALHRALYSVEE
ncbi:MAG: LCP family protein [Clostridia bacterium]|nr:LCP family protein [Clostridia bacterium]